MGRPRNANRADRHPPSPGAQLGRAFGLLGGIALAANLSCGPRRAPPAAFEGPVLEQQAKERGLQIEIMRLGQGQKTVQKGDWVALHYATRLSGGPENGRLVELSRKPLDFIVGRTQGLIEGLHLGVVGMRPGELRRLQIPPQLGYRGRSMQAIPADAVLRMDIELVRHEPTEH